MPRHELRNSPRWPENALNPKIYSTVKYVSYHGESRDELVGEFMAFVPLSLRHKFGDTP
jgi:hypothetical protein